ncbi:MAG: carbon-nitrogen hydrolase family protein [Gammaproteobacteria bacterium]|nr:carbon-nitrogen hydrolase family protein [Gammaproteobacteria bacterium]
MSTFDVACIQNCAANDLDANLAKVETLVRAAVADGADLVCLPEFYCLLEPSDGSYYDNGYDEDAHPALAHGRTLAAELSRWLLLGSMPVRAAGGKVHNRGFLLAPDGGIAARYDKIHLFDVVIRDGQDYRESAGVAPGDCAVVAPLPWGRLGLSICYDVRFPQLFRQLAQAGADFLAVPAAFTAKTGAAHWHTLLRARAIENGCFVFAPGQCGVRPWGRRTYGHSLIIDPWGEILADAGDDEGYVIATVDPARVAEVRRMIPSLHHDRPIAPPAP